MNPAIFLLFEMLAISLTLVTILSIAWAGFGRPRHALSWATAYGVAALNWSSYGTMVLGWMPVAVGRPLMLSLGAASGTLVAIGFRQRAGLRPHLRSFALLTILTAMLLVWVGWAAPGGVADRIVLPMHLALTHLLSAATLVGRNWTSNLTERATCGALVLGGAYYLGLGAMAVAQGNVLAPDQALLFRDVQLFGTPTIFLMTGLFAVFLLAADLAERMRKLAILDPLTGVLNRRGLEQAAEQAIANSRRTGQPLSVVMADLDRFKQINDTRGHAAGDRALRHFATHVERAIRKGDLFGRVGGEEFALVLAGAGPTVAAEVAERIRAGLSELDAGSEDLRLTCSFGVAALARGDAGFPDVSGRADAALYSSKLDGRDRVTVAPPPEVMPSGPEPSPAAACGAATDRPASPRRQAQRR